MAPNDTVLSCVAALLTRKPRLVVVVALTNKIARIAWAVMTRGDTFRTAASRSPAVIYSVSNDPDGIRGTTPNH